MKKEAVQRLERELAEIARTMLIAAELRDPRQSLVSYAGRVKHAGEVLKAVRISLPDDNETKPDSEPVQTRTVTRFLWYPRQAMDGEWRWLCKARFVEVYLERWSMCPDQSAHKVWAWYVEKFLP